MFYFRFVSEVWFSLCLFDKFLVVEERRNRFGVSDEV